MKKLHFVASNYHFAGWEFCADSSIASCNLKWWGWQIPMRQNCLVYWGRFGAFQSEAWILWYDWSWFPICSLSQCHRWQNTEIGTSHSWANIKALKYKFFCATWVWLKSEGSPSRIEIRVVCSSHPRGYNFAKFPEIVMELETLETTTNFSTQQYQHKSENVPSICCRSIYLGLNSPFSFEFGQFSANFDGTKQSFCSRQSLELIECYFNFRYLISIF